MTTRVLRLNTRQSSAVPAGEGVYIGRGSPWGNPFVIGRDGTREEVIARFASMLRHERRDLIDKARRELKGKALLCFCHPDPCHGDVLARVAEGDEP